MVAGFTEKNEIPKFHKEDLEKAKAKIILAKITAFGKLTSEDKRGHEFFASETEMRKFFEKCYSCQLTKIIFENYSI